MAEPTTDITRRRRPLAGTLAVAAGFAVATGLTRLIPAEYRPYNFTAVGALALFAAARLGLWQALAIATGAMLSSDLLLWRQNGYDPDHLPIATVYVGIAVYALAAWLFLRRTENPVRIGGVAVAAGFLFFLVTNFASWLGQALPYGYSLGGLLDSYWMGLPFYRGTLTGDLLFTGLLFGAHAVLSRAFFPAERVVPAEVRA